MNQRRSFLGAFIALVIALLITVPAVAHTTGSGTHEIEMQNESNLTASPGGNIIFRSIEGVSLSHFGGGADGLPLPVSDGQCSYPDAPLEIVLLNSNRDTGFESGFAIGSSLSFDKYYAGAEFSRIGSGDTFAISDPLLGTGCRIQGDLVF